jgi:hypothetical protein
MRNLFAILRKLRADTGGSISILAAFVLVGTIGVSALALEYGHGLLQKTENQRAADLAAYGGALVYGSTSSSSDATSAANNIAALNGLSGDATPSVVSSPTGDGNNAVKVTVTSNVPLLLARVLTTSTTLPVSATTYAEIKSDAPGCVIALSGSGSGVTMDGGTSVTAANCAVASNQSVHLSGGAALVAQNVDYGGAAPDISGGAAITPPTGDTLHMNHVTTPDPLAPASGSPGSTEVTNAIARITSVSSITSQSVSPGTGGIDVYFDYGGKKSTTASSLNSDGCPTATFNSAAKTWTVSCGSTVTFGNISLQGGLTVNFTTAGTYNFAPSSVVCNSTTGYSICNTGTALSFAGPSTFALAGGIYNTGGASLSLGSGSTNSYNIGKAGDGNSINVGTSKIMTFANATGNGDTFQTAGNITSGGGSCLALPVAAEHDINGSIDASGGLVLGSGIYTINGYFALGASSGGDVSNCPTSGTTTGLSALDVTLVIAGASTVTCNGVATSAFCLGAGYSTVDLTAPSSPSSTASLAVIGPQSSSNTAAAAFTTGATNTQISGAFYFPNGPVTMSGAASLHDTIDTSPCLELVGSQVTLGGGAADASTCVGLGGGSLGTTVSLVQ